MKPVVYLDLDGVVVDLLTPWFRLHNEVYGTDYDPHSIESYNDLPFDRRMTDLLSWPGLHYGAKPYNGAQLVVYELWPLCELYLVSAVPRNRNALWEKHQWMECTQWNLLCPFSREFFG